MLQTSVFMSAFRKQWACGLHTHSESYHVQCVHFNLSDHISCLPLIYIQSVTRHKQPEVKDHWMLVGINVMSRPEGKNGKYTH